MRRRSAANSGDHRHRHRPEGVGIFAPREDGEGGGVAPQSPAPSWRINGHVVALVVGEGPRPADAQPIAAGLWGALRLVER